MGGGASRFGCRKSSATQPSSGAGVVFTGAATTEASAIVCKSSAQVSPSDKSSFFQFCDQNKLDLESGIAEALEGCPACVTSSGPGEPIVWLNEEFVQLSGFQREEMLGQPCKFLQGEKTTHASRAEVRRLIETQTEGFVSLVNYTKQGKEFDNALYIRPLYSKGKCLFFLGSQLDLRGLKRFKRSVSFHDEPEVFMFEDDAEKAQAPLAFYQFCDQNQLEVESGLAKLLAMPSDPGTLKAMRKDYSRLARLGHLQEAVEMTQEVLEMQLRELGPVHPETLGTMSAYATRLAEMGLLPEAAAIEKQLLELQKTVLGPHHLQTLTTMNNFANRLGRLGWLQEAADMSLEMLELQIARLGPRHPETLITMSNYANRLNEQGRLQEGADMTLSVLELRRIVLGPRHPNTLRTLNNYACCLQVLGRAEEAAQSRREFRKLREK